MCCVVWFPMTSYLSIYLAVRRPMSLYVESLLLLRMTANVPAYSTWLMAHVLVDVPCLVLQ